MKALPYTGKVSQAEQFDQMQKAVNSGFPFLKKATAFHNRKVSIVGYGPSLADTWRSIQGPIIATSGAYDFLIERGIVPDYYVAIDPSRSAIDLLKKPSKISTYLMASVCHPDWWPKLDLYRVKLWHKINGDDQKTIEWIHEHHMTNVDSALGGGSTVAQRAMNVAAAMGYRKFDVYGMDCSFIDKRHAGPHTGDPQLIVDISVAGRIFRTTPQLMQSANEMQQFLLTADVEIAFHGDSLMSEIASMIQKRRS